MRQTNHTVTFSLLGLILGAIHPAFAQQVSFYHGKTAYPAIGTLALATGDFNGDGEVDTLAATQFTMAVYPGKSNGLFGAPITTTIKSSCESNLLVTDFNGDGKLDFACLFGSSFQVGLGVGDGTFHTPFVYSGQGLQGLNAGDFNGDGIPDLVSYTSNSVLVYFGLGNGFFLKPISTPITQGSFTSIHPADVDGDGKSDIVATRGDSVVILFGRGDGGFQVPVIVVLKSASADSATTADLDADGTTDILISINSEAVNLPVPHLAVLLQGPNGHFHADYYASQNPLTQLQVADLNGDGLPDVVAAGSAGGAQTLSVLRGSGKGVLTSPDTYYVPAEFYRIANPRHQAVPDIIYSDGQTIALFPNQGNGKFTPDVQVQEGGTAPCVSGDFDNDGLTDLACLDSYAITVFYGTGQKSSPLGRSVTVDLIGPASTIVAGDFNHDGNLDFEAGLVDGTVQFVQNLGGGAFSQPSQRSNAGPGFQVLATGDFNNDGNLDLLTGGGNFLAGNGDGTFAPLVSFYLGTFQSFGVADFNGDGLLDAFGLAGGEMPPVVLIGLGTGQFSATVLSAVNASYRPAIADLNGDGLLDVIVPAARFGTTILLNGGGGNFVQAPPIFNDFWPPTLSVVVADFNRDGKLDVVFGLQNSSVWPVTGNGDGTFQPTTTGFSVEDATSLSLLNTGTGKRAIAAGSNVITVLESREDPVSTAERRYSLRRASMGSSLAALRAGR